MSFKPLAFYKTRPTHTLPYRPGVVQAIRNCTFCIGRQDDRLKPDDENIIALQTYEDLASRDLIWLSDFRSILYHSGQISIVKKILEISEPEHTLYVVACTQIRDLEYLKSIFRREFGDLNIQVHDHHATTSLSKTLDPKMMNILPIYLPSCRVRHAGASDRLINQEQLAHLLGPIVNDINDSKMRDTMIVPIVISREYDDLSSLEIISGKAVGSLCLQALEPYSLGKYTKRFQFEEPADHFARHIYYDLALNLAHLPSHMVAFIILHLNREEQGVSRQDIIEYLDWMRKNSLEFDIHMPFSGPSESVLDLALIILKEFILIDSKNDIYRPIDWDALQDYALTLAPNFTCFGIICRAILKLYNSDTKNNFCVYFKPGTRVKVMKDDVIEHSIKLATEIDSKIPWRRPCATISTSIIETFNKMQTFGKYFKINEPKVRRNTGKHWAGDYDSDEDYYWSKKDDPAFKTWLTLTDRPYRLDRLNTFLNSVDTFFS